MVAATHPSTLDRPKVVGLAVPLMLSSFASAGLGLVGAVQVAPLGAGALAAVGFGAMVTSLLQTIGLGLFAGGRIAIAQAVGAGDAARARDVAKTLVLLALALAAIALLSIPLAEALMRAIGAPHDVAPEAAAF